MYLCLLFSYIFNLFNKPLLHNCFNMSMGRMLQDILCWVYLFACMSVHNILDLYKVQYSHMECICIGSNTFGWYEHLLLCDLDPLTLEDPSVRMMFHKHISFIHTGRGTLGKWHFVKCLKITFKENVFLFKNSEPVLTNVF